jgi:hypothetical protein
MSSELADAFGRAKTVETAYWVAEGRMQVVGRTRSRQIRFDERYFLARIPCVG